MASAAEVGQSSSVHGSGSVSGGGRGDSSCAAAGLAAAVSIAVRLVRAYSELRQLAALLDSFSRAVMEGAARGGGGASAALAAQPALIAAVAEAARTVPPGAGAHLSVLGP